MINRRRVNLRLALQLCMAGILMLVASLTEFAHASPAFTERFIALAPLLGPQVAQVFMPTGAPTESAAPHDLTVSNTLTIEEQQAVHTALGLLHRCAPPLDDYVRSHITLVTRGDHFTAKEVIGYIRQGESIVYLPSGTILGDRAYPDSVRTLLTAANLVHEARHVEMGRNSTEPDAYRFELQVFVPACYPGDVDPVALNQYRQLIVADAYP